MSRSDSPVIMIPARLESSRLPRKALLKISGIPMIVHVAYRCMRSKVASRVIVCTDSVEIARCVLTSALKYASRRRKA